MYFELQIEDQFAFSGGVGRWIGMPILSSISICISYRYLYVLCLDLTITYRPTWHHPASRTLYQKTSG